MASVEIRRRESVFEHANACNAAMSLTVTVSETASWKQTIDVPVIGARGSEGYKMIYVSLFDRERCLLYGGISQVPVVLA